MVTGKEGRAISEEDDLVKRIRNGETESFRILIERYRGYLFQVVLSVVRHPKDAEDVTQEVFLRIYSALPQYQYQGFKTWITRIAVNKAIDHTRRARSQKAEPVECIEDYASFREDEPSVEGAYLDKEKKELLHRSLQQIPDNYRDILHAYYIEDKSYQEIAAEQGIERKSVESKLYRARQWLRKHWKEEDFR
ncbi:sigma-70 family RNA polymerase sigma factor [Paenibacillus aurantius]|uniref:RNA polymerase sigma factor n=1 Tax=Paenibacillus aurantius TaxID=2918900 RepID=A0AA96LEI9_9BACL|nr:sigma-70 family RNA polymerase sigma factor [Paenibacillus aurantius]WNQ11523.1 sigma-70 family RNA polymerase sigma factor [Paenibacillus aurantius]